MAKCYYCDEEKETRRKMITEPEIGNMTVEICEECESYLDSSGERDLRNGGDNR